MKIKLGGRVIDETPNLRWFEEYPSCRECGKPAAGILRGHHNDSYGSYCRKHAEKRLADSAKVREYEGKGEKDA